jgi:hypothetical protein
VEKSPSFSPDLAHPGKSAAEGTEPSIPGYVLQSGPPFFGQIFQERLQGLDEEEEKEAPFGPQLFFQVLFGKLILQEAA